MLAKSGFAGIMILGLAGFAPGAAMAQDPQGDHSLGAFIGFTDRHDTDITVGAEYEYRPDRQLSFGALVELTPDAYGNSSATVAMGTVNFRLQPRLKLTGGIGYEFNDFDDSLRFRIGAGYDAIQGPFTVTPRVSVDFGDNREHVVFGVTGSMRF